MTLALRYEILQARHGTFIMPEVTREHALVSTRSSSSINAALLAYDDAIFTSVFLCDVGGGDLGSEF
jgi:hypothetical protein